MTKNSQSDKPSSSIPTSRCDEQQDNEKPGSSGCIFARQLERELAERDEECLLLSAQVRSLNAKCAEYEATARPSLAAQGWIPVTERKPESSLPGVIASHMEGPYQTYWLAFYFKNRDRWEHAYKEHPKHLTNVTHWMPLPAPPGEFRYSTLW